MDQQRQRASRETNAAKIEVVKSEQRLAHLQAQRSQLERDQQERGARWPTAARNWASAWRG